MALRDDLIAAKALIDTPEKWSHGTALSYQDGNTRICAWIALHRAINTTGGRLMAVYDAIYSALPVWWHIRAAFRDEVRDAWIIRFNDHRSTKHADIMALFDRAIKAAEAA